MTIFTHHLSKPLVRALRDVANVSKGKPFHLIGLANQGLLTHSQTSNFYKLRFWALIEPVSHGIWRVTPRGMEFIMGLLPVSKNALTYRNEVKEYAGELVTPALIWDGWTQIEDYVREAQPLDGDDQPRLI
jgi:hypothetical protein